MAKSVHKIVSHKRCLLRLRTQGNEDRSRGAHSDELRVDAYALRYQEGSERAGGHHAGIVVDACTGKS